MMLQVQRFSDPRLFIDRAESFLTCAEAQNNLMLGIAGPPGSPRRVFGEACYLATVEDSGHVVACAIRTPPYKAVITRGNRSALEVLVDDLAQKYDRLPAVLGPEPEVRLFAELWTNKTGTRARAGMQQRLFEAREVQPPGFLPSGVLRVAEEVDLPIIAPWAAAFFEEAGLTDPSDPYHVARQRVHQREVFVWDDRGAVSMAAWTGRTQRGIRINFVYTPPERRRRGYASACVAALTQRLLDEGQAFCCLYTDLANPTSNKIYQSIGYRLVCDMSDFHFDAG